MAYTNREEVRKLLANICDPTLDVVIKVNAMSKIAWWIGYLEGYIGEEEMKELEK